MKLGMPQLFECDILEDNLRIAKDLKLDFVELNLNFGCCRKEMEEGKVGRLLKEYGIEATLHFYDEADFGSYDEVVEAYLGLLERYTKLGEGIIRQVNVHLNPGPVVTVAGTKNYIYEKEYDAYINRLIKNLRKAQSICLNHKMGLVVENTDITPEYSRDVYQDLHSEGFRFCFDIGHDHLSHDLLWNFIQKTPLPFDEFHIHDAKDRAKCHLALGEGTLDIAKFKRLAEENNAYVVLEVKQKEDVISSVPFFRNL